MAHSELVGLIQVGSLLLKISGTFPGSGTKALRGRELGECDVLLWFDWMQSIRPPQAH